jgi:Phosphoinositide 3-kinase C2
VGLFGVAGLPLTALQSHTTSARVWPRQGAHGSSHPETAINVSNATHDCLFDSVIHIPIRWRDLPRDAYLHFRVLGRSDTVIFQTTMPFFSQYGKLATGLQKLKLSAGPLDPSINYGLVPYKKKQSNADDDGDAVWKALKTLEQLNIMEEKARTSAEQIFGETPCVPWLDLMQKDRAKKIIADAVADGNVRNCATRTDLT